MNAINLPALLEIKTCPPVASADFYELLMQFGLNLIVVLILARAMYYTWNRKPEYMFAQIITGMIVFLICAMLRWVQLELGLVLGLFAIFAIIRFRTLNVPVKEMAYLFMVVGVSAINALLRLNQCPQWIIFTNLVLLALTFIMEKVFFGKRLSRRTITYPQTDLLKPSKYELLLQEIKDLTELDIVRLEIGKVDYVKRLAQIRIFYTGVSGAFGEGEGGNDED